MQIINFNYIIKYSSRDIIIFKLKNKSIIKKIIFIIYILEIYKLNQKKLLK